VHRGKPSSVVDAVAKGEVLGVDVGPEAAILHDFIARGFAAQHAVDAVDRAEKLAAIARKIRTLATFNSSGASVEAIDDAKERRAFRLALYEIADELEEL
jgi:hypothetical protein